MKKRNIHEETHSNVMLISTAVSMILLTFIFFDVVTMYVAIEIFHINENISKVLANILVIIFNYLASKLIIFKK